MNQFRRQLLSRALYATALAIYCKLLETLASISFEQKKETHKMLNIRYANERGPSNLGWLKSMHTFSFAGYYDPRHMGFESLRVINDDKVIPGAGFGTHPHNNMEIISYVLDGALEHKDSMGNGSVIKSGDVQRMSAGTGVTHSEYNHSKSEGVHFLQIWFLPKKRNVKPSYEQKMFEREDKLGKLKLVVSPTGRDGSVSINQDVDMYAGILENKKQSFTHKVKKNRKAWVHIAQGTLEVNGEKVSVGDGIAVNGGETLEFDNAKKAEVIIFDMALMKT